MISKEQLDKFKKIYKDRFGKELSNEDASEKAAKLLSLMRIVYKPMTKEDLLHVKERRQELNHKIRGK